MRTPRRFRSRGASALSAHGLHATSAFALAFLLLGGLACDEKTRASTEPAAPSDLGADAGSGGPLLAAKSKLVLPVNEDVATTAPDPAFRINQTGTGPNGIFQISPTTTNDETALQGLTTGSGRAGHFQITNTANTEPALQAETNGQGDAVRGLATNGDAIHGVTTGSGNAIRAISTGPGRAGFFNYINAVGSATALEVETTTNQFGIAFIVDQLGLGYGGIFTINNASSSGIALQARTQGTGEALRVDGPSLFNGNVTVNGTLTKPAGSFRIDHPLDPEHKYLSHSFVESPDMMNVYNGNVTLDSSGRATVDLPDYFEALNRDFRYQLTPIGAPGPDLYIAEGVEQNHFRVAGGRAYAHVSWQVTGVRHDTYAEQHRIKVEEEKPRAVETPRAGKELVARQ